MKRITLIVCIALLCACATPEKKTTEESVAHEHAESNDHGDHSSEAPKEVKKPLSPRTSSMSNIGDNHVHIDYGSPGKRGRMIFGGLVGYGTIWATGAHKATYINFGKDVIVNDVAIATGKYGLFTIPGESEWTIIISKDWDMHLADEYDEANDIVRIQAPVQNLDEVVESLTFEINEADEKNGTVTIKWDQTAVFFDVKNQ